MPNIQRRLKSGPEKESIEDGVSKSHLDYTSEARIDRVFSAWLIQRFIDSRATFLFGSDPKAHPGAVPFDMYQAGGFDHEGENCTFETLCAVSVSQSLRMPWRLNSP